MDFHLLLVSLHFEALDLSENFRPAHVLKFRLHPAAGYSADHFLLAHGSPRVHVQVGRKWFVDFVEALLKLVPGIRLASALLFRLQQLALGFRLPVSVSGGDLTRHDQLPRLIERLFGRSFRIRPMDGDDIRHLRLASVFRLPAREAIQELAQRRRLLLLAQRFHRVLLPLPATLLVRKRRMNRPARIAG